VDIGRSHRQGWRRIKSSPAWLSGGEAPGKRRKEPANYGQGEYGPMRYSFGASVRLIGNFTIGRPALEDENSRRHVGILMYPMGFLMDGTIHNGSETRQAGKERMQQRPEQDSELEAHAQRDANREKKGGPPSPGARRATPRCGGRAGQRRRPAGRGHNPKGEPIGESLVSRQRLAPGGPPATGESLGGGIVDLGRNSSMFQRPRAMILRAA